MRRQVEEAVVELLHADITTVPAEAVVNAANAALAGGGGVDGAIHRAAGPALAAACRELPFVAPGVRCPTGEVRSTTAGNMDARYVIHAVGPIFDSRDQQASAAALASAYTTALSEAARLGCRTVVLPALSTGAYRYPLRSAARIAARAVLDVLHAHPRSFDRVSFALFGERDLEVFTEAFEEVLASGT